MSDYMDLFYAFSTLLRLVNDLQTENNELYNKITWLKAEIVELKHIIEIGKTENQLN